jgi:NitT/TauT family transport system substrate-binding protein
MGHLRAICAAPLYLAEDMLRLEGFSQVEYAEMSAAMSAANFLSPSGVILAGKADFSVETAPVLIPQLEAGQEKLVVLGGLHAGCYELFGSDRVRTMLDLKGKAIGIRTFGAHDHVFIASMLAYVGVEPNKDVTWIETGTLEGPMRLFIDGATDAFLGFAPQPRDLREQGIGHVLINTSQDRPWSRNFCCLLVASRDFVNKYPVSTKKVLRSFLKASDICSEQPEFAARYLAQQGFEPRYEVGLEVLKTLPYDWWRVAHPEDTLRFYALRLHEVGMIKTPPNDLIARGTDWRFLNELKKELKA